jgi:hypothetical protein
MRYCVIVCDFDEGLSAYGPFTHEEAKVWLEKSGIGCHQHCEILPLCGPIYRPSGTKTPHITLCGTMAGGFMCTGPYDSFEDAEQASHNYPEHCWFLPLQSPDRDQRVYEGPYLLEWEDSGGDPARDNQVVCRTAEQAVATLRHWLDDEVVHIEYPDDYEEAGATQDGEAPAFRYILGDDPIDTLHHLDRTLGINQECGGGTIHIVAVTIE